jgi:uncharacterized protein DUF6916
MPVSRRSFLRSGATAVLTAGIAINAAPLVFGQSVQTQGAAVPFEAQQSPLFYFKRETFQPYVGGTFRVSAGRSTVEMTLKEVLDLTASAKSNRAMKATQQTDSFALIFSSGEQLTDLTTIYDVEHAGLGKFSLFLTRRDDAPNARVHVYEAVFNHFR